MSLSSHSDLHNIYGELPMTTHIPGHEGVGRVVSGEIRLHDLLQMGSCKGHLWTVLMVNMFYKQSALVRLAK